MKVRSAVRATASIRQAIAYSQKHSPQTVETFKDGMRACRARLGSQPKSARLTDLEGVRVALLRRCPYLVPYTITEETVLLVDVWYAARERTV